MPGRRGRRGLHFCRESRAIPVDGAPQTFDDAGYAALLRRLVDQREGEVVYAPAFERDLEEPIAGAIRVEASVPLVITEGNYLLAETGAWPLAFACLDETWFLDLDPQVRLARLIARHERFGKSPGAARRSWPFRWKWASCASKRRRPQ